MRMLPSMFRKIIIIDTWQEVWRSPDQEEAMVAAQRYAQNEKLSFSRLTGSAAEIGGREYDVVPSMLFRGSYGVKLIRR